MKVSKSNRDRSGGAGATSASRLGSFLRRTRKERNLSQFQLATLTEGFGTKVSRSEISALEQGKRLPRLDNLLSLSHALRLNPAEVLDRVQLSSTNSINLTGKTYEELKQQAEEYFWAGRYNEDLAALDAMADLLVLDPPKSTNDQQQYFAYIELRRGGTLRRLGALLAAKEAAERAICSSAKWPEIQSQAYMVLSTVHLRMAQYQLALDAAARSVAIAEFADDKIKGRALNTKARTLLAGGHFQEARDVFVEARDLVRRSSDTHHLVHIEGNIGCCDFSLKRFKRSEQWILRAIDQAKRYDMPAHESEWLVTLSKVIFEQGELERADQYALQGLGIARRLENWLVIFRGEWLRHKIAKALDPKIDENNRLSMLKKLHRRLHDHRDEEDLREFNDYEVRRSQ